MRAPKSWGLQSAPALRDALEQSNLLLLRTGHRRRASSNVRAGPPQSTTLERMAFQVTSTSINPNHAKWSTYMALRNPVVLRLTLATVALITCSCVTVTLVPGADKVKLTHNAADVAACKAVGNVSAQPDLNRQFVEFQLRNRTVGLDGNALFYTTTGDYEGVAYRCP